MNHTTKKTAFIIMVISMSSILMSVTYAIYSVGSLSNPSVAQYPTIIVDGSAPREVVGVVIDKNLTVIAVEPDSAAKQSGIEVGDVVLEINGQAIKNIDDVKKEISEVVVVLPTDSPESAKLSQEVKDATAVAYIKSSLASKNVDKIVITIMRNKENKLTIDVDKKPQVGTSEATPTPVSSSDLYF